MTEPHTSAAAASREGSGPVFFNADLADPDNITKIESLCMNCEKQGETKLLLTDIPFFRKVVLMAFECEHCGFRNSEVQNAGEIQEKGVIFTLKVRNEADLSRELVKSDTAKIIIPELEFEIPPSTQRGSMNTVEGVLQATVEALSFGLEERRQQAPEMVPKLATFLAQLRQFLLGDVPFTFILEDPAGNSFLQNPNAPALDPSMTVHHFNRSKAQCEALAIPYAPGSTEAAEAAIESGSVSLNESGGVTVASLLGTGGGTTLGTAVEEDSSLMRGQEVMAFKGDCYSCDSQTETRMLMTPIPHFKEVVVMCTTCDNCGYRSSEIKSGAGVSPKATKVTLRITDPEDLSRDVLKAETACLRIPELGLELDSGTLGGRFTTIEGLLAQVHDSLDNANPFTRGDSADAEDRTKFAAFLAALADMKDGKVHFTLELDDPVSNSYIQNIYAPDPDPEMTIVEYERTFEQNEDLGLNDIDVDDYVHEAPAEEAR